MALENYRIISFISIFTLMFFLEFTFKKRSVRFNTKRILNNIIIFLSGVVLVQITFPGGVYKLVNYIQLHSPNIIHLNKLPLALDIICTILLFDLAIYCQHVLFHKVPFLWKFHLVHHCDNQMDATTALRFHPVEILVSVGVKMSLIYILNPSIISYLCYEILLNSMALFNHANIKLHPRLDKKLRLLIATPSFHTPHHSPETKYTNSNYANFLSLWDYLFKTYQPLENEHFGVENKLIKDNNSLPELLFSPFKAYRR